MLFSSITFLFKFLPVSLILYYVAPEKLKNFIMLAASLFFYAWGEPVYVVLMILSVFLNYICGLDMANKAQDKIKSKRSLIFAVTANVLLLGFFKYYGFFMNTLKDIFPIDITYRQLPIPIGISFYTFQAISYLLDIYKEEAKPQKNLLYFALYISMFPQLIAGPIVRYADIENQLEARYVSMRKFGSGAEKFIIGLAKKVIIANSAGYIFEQVMQMKMGSFSVLTAWVGCISYTIQIYFDFSGYSDMAIGLGKMFGFDFRKNFDYPYVSLSITEFWRRWHISLSTWFREYVYIPLGGNRLGKPRQIQNLIIVWLLTGLWHGGTWNFLVWGLYYGVLLILEKFVWGEAIEHLSPWLKHTYTLVFVMLGWVLFFSPSLGYAVNYIGMLLGIGASAVIDKTGLFLIFSNWLLFVLAFLGSSQRGFSIFKKGYMVYSSQRARRIAAAALYIGCFLIAVVFLVTESFNPFLYFKF